LRSLDQTFLGFLQNLDVLCHCFLKPFIVGLELVNELN
jgi:hypothetical protein